jgi:hypothetical protein
MPLQPISAHSFWATITNQAHHSQAPLRLLLQNGFTLAEQVMIQTADEAPEAKRAENSLRVQNSILTW